MNFMNFSEFRCFSCLAMNERGRARCPWNQKKPGELVMTTVTRAGGGAVDGVACSVVMGYPGNGDGADPGGTLWYCSGSPPGPFSSKFIKIQSKSGQLNSENDEKIMKIRQLNSENDEKIMKIRQSDSRTVGHAVSRSVRQSDSRTRGQSVSQTRG